MSIVGEHLVAGELVEVVSALFNGVGERTEREQAALFGELLGSVIALGRDWGMTLGNLQAVLEESWPDATPVETEAVPLGGTPASAQRRVKVALEQLLAPSSAEGQADFGSAAVFASYADPTGEGSRMAHGTAMRETLVSDRTWRDARHLIDAMRQVAGELEQKFFPPIVTEPG